jgi:hypothetical protein
VKMSGYFRGVKCNFPLLDFDQMVILIVTSFLKELKRNIRETSKITYTSP